MENGGAGSAKLGQYRILARIATGGMAELFFARREGPAGFRKIVAIKRLLPHLTKEPKIVEMFLDEARIASRFDHPNVVQVFDLGEADGSYFLAMEFLEGRSLSEVAERAAELGELVPLGIMARVLAEACLGLHDAHDARDDAGQPLGVVHRDFNPSNVFVTYDGRVKVLDFGIAKIQSLSRESEPGVLRGKYYYMSPEMVAGRPVDRRADLFAAGGMLYELLTGRHPFEADDVRSLLVEIGNCSPEPPRQLEPEVPPSLDSLCCALLQRSPSDRPPTAQAVAERLERFLTETKRVVGPSEIAAYMERLFPQGEDLRRRQIAELRRAQSLDAPELAPVPPPTADAAPPEAPRPRPGRTAVEAPGKLPQEERPRLRDRPRILLVLAGALVMVIAFVAWRFRLGRGAAMSELDQARAAFQRGNLDSARSRLERLVSANPSDEQAHLLLGQLLSAQRHGQRAEAELRAALRLAPRDPAPPRALAELRVAQGDLPGAVKLLVEARRLAPDDGSIGLELGGLYGRLGDWKRSAATLEGAIERKGQDAGGWADLGFARYQLGEDSRAASAIARALRLEPGLARAWYYQGFLEYRRGHVDKAIESYRTAAAKDPSSSAALLALGQLYRDRHEQALAEGAFKDALARDPGNETARAALADPGH